MSILNRIAWVVLIALWLGLVIVGTFSLPSMKSVYCGFGAAAVFLLIWFIWERGEVFD